MITLSVLSVLSVVNSSHSAVGIVLRTTPPGNGELHPSSSHFGPQDGGRPPCLPDGGLWPRKEWDTQRTGRWETLPPIFQNENCCTPSCPD